MNIFKILSADDGTINEPNVSSFLSYFLDPAEDHGISCMLLQSIIEQFLKKSEDNFKSIKSNDNSVVDLSKKSKYVVDVLSEFRVDIKDGNKQRRDIDVLIEISEKMNNEKDELKFSIAIENKIADSSINLQDTQLEEELLGLQTYYSEADLTPEIYFVFLTPSDSAVANEKFKKLETDKKLHIFWNELGDYPSISRIINEILEKDNRGNIDPIMIETRYLLKSFISFIRSGFKSYIEEKNDMREKTNYGKPVFEYLKDYINEKEHGKELDLDELRKGFTEYIKDKTNKSLNSGTRYAKFIVGIINNQNRGHYQVTKKNMLDKSLLYYPNESDQTKVMRISDKTPADTKVYYKDKDYGVNHYMNYGDLKPYDETINSGEGKCQ